MKKILEVLTKSTNGQWSLFKAWVKDEKDSTPYKNFQNAYPTLGGADRLKSGNPNKHLQAGNRTKIDGLIKSNKMEDLDKFIMSQPKGSIDFDHVHKNLDGIVSNGSMKGWFDHHTEDAKSLDDLYHNHGGIGAVEHALQRGDANGTPWMYMLDYEPNAKNKHLYSDVMDALNPGKGKADWDGEAESEFPGDEAKQKARKDEYQGSDLDKYHHPGKHKRVVDTFDDLMENSDLDEPHNKAAYDRAIDAFKRKHKLIL